MARLLVALLLLPVSLALAAEDKTASPADDPMAAWVPPKLTNEAKDKKEIQAVFQAMDAASKRGDIEAAAALVDFPVLMATDDSKGEAMGDTWNRERWIEVMKPFYDKPRADMKVTHKPTIFVLSDSLASVDDVATVKMGAKTVTMRNSTLLVRRDGKWLVKAMAEPGWGDMSQMQAAGSPSSSQGTGSSGAQEPPSSQGTGSSGAKEPPSSQGAGSSGAQEPPSSQGTGSSGAKEPPSSQGTGSSVQEPRSTTTTTK